MTEEEKDLEQIIKEQFSALPEKMQETLVNMDMEKIFSRITEKNKISLDRAEGFYIEVYMIILGLAPLSRFVDNLIKNGNFSREEALLLAKDVEEMIFSKMKDELDYVNGKNVIKKEGSGLPVQLGEEKAGTTQILEEKIPIRKDIPQTQSSVKPIETKTYSPQNQIEEKIYYPAGYVPKTETPKAPEETKVPIKTPEVVAEKSIPQNKNIPEIRPNNLPEVEMAKDLPKVNIPNIQTPSYSDKPSKNMFHQNIPPVPNIVEKKINESLIVPKETVIINDESKIPQKSSVDPYREPIL